MNDNKSDEKTIFRLVQKISEYSGLPVDVLQKRLRERKMDSRETITLLMEQLFCYEQEDAAYSEPKKPGRRKQERREEKSGTTRTTPLLT